MNTSSKKWLAHKYIAAPCILWNGNKIKGKKILPTTLRTEVRPSAHVNGQESLDFRKMMLISYSMNFWLFIKGTIPFTAIMDNAVILF